VVPAFWPPAAGTGDRAGAGAGTLALPPVNVTESPAAVSATSPAEEAVTEGTGPVAVRVRPPWAGRARGRLVVPGHTTLAPLGPSDTLTVSLVAAVTVAEPKPASPETAAGGNVMVRLTPVGWMGLPGFAVAGRLTRTATWTGRVPVGKRHR
jgi:hypothetical protein